MFDPISLWMQSSLFWIRVFKQQQDMYLVMLGQAAEKLPHESAEDLSREAEAMKNTTPDAKKTARRPATKAAKKTIEMAPA